MLLSIGNPQSHSTFPFPSWKIMKFTGLILICASSCLALVLPAIGFVSFPKLNQTTHTTTKASGGIPASFPSVVQNIPGPYANNAPWFQSTPQQDFLPNSNNETNSLFPAAILPPGYAIQTQLAAPSPSFPEASTGNILGIGIWLLLVPVCLIGLTMWTFSPNPTGQ